MAERTRAELARRYEVHRSTVARALAAAAQRHAAGLGAAPPQPVNPGEPTPRYDLAEMDAWWPTRPTVGRPVGGSQFPPPRPLARQPRHRH